MFYLSESYAHFELDGVKYIVFFLRILVLILKLETSAEVDLMETNN